MAITKLQRQEVSNVQDALKSMPAPQNKHPAIIYATSELADAKLTTALGALKIVQLAELLYVADEHGQLADLASVALNFPFIDFQTWESVQRTLALGWLVTFSADAALAEALRVRVMSQIQDHLKAIDVDDLIDSPIEYQQANAGAGNLVAQVANALGEVGYLAFAKLIGGGSRWTDPKIDEELRRVIVWIRQTIKI